MKSLLMSVLSVLVFAFVAHAQSPCTGYPPHVSPVPLNLECNEISNSGNFHFSIFVCPTEGGGQTFSYVVNNIPTYPTEPAVYFGVATLAVNQIAPAQFPGAGPSCLWATDLTIFLNPTVVTGPACTTIPMFVWPAVPGLAGFTFYTQLAMHDSTQDKWAVSDQLSFVIQP